MRGSRANVASPTQRGTWEASTGPMTPSAEMTRGRGALAGGEGSLRAGMSMGLVMC